MEQSYKNCQSCGMPMKKDPVGGGSNADGSKSTMYCSHCYEGGKFKQAEITVSEMQELVKGKLKEMGFPGFIAGWFAKKTPKLKRWNK